MVGSLALNIEIASLTSEDKPAFDSAVFGTAAQPPTNNKIHPETTIDN